MIIVNLIEFVNYSDQRLKTLKETMTLIQEILNSEKFKSKVLNFTTDGKKTFHYRKNFFGKSIEKKYTNKEVYDIIMKGIEKQGNIDGAMDLYLNLIIGANGSTIGYGNPGTKEIYTYSDMFDDMTKQELASHYTHEWCHKLGFSHSKPRNRLRNFSVPYGIGDIIEQIADDIV